MYGARNHAVSKRKRNWHIEHSSFLEERSQQLRRANFKTVEAADSLSKAWLRCGEGFQDTSETLSLASEKTGITEKQLELSPRPKTETTSKNASELANITWSSSESDFSDEDKTLPELQRDGGRVSRADRLCDRTVLHPEDGDLEDELQVIDWEINSDTEDPGGPFECEDDEGALDISDCASCTSLTSDDRLCESPEPISTEILEYSSESEREDDPEHALFIDAESPHKHQVDFKSDARQVLVKRTDSEVNSPEPTLSTPQKYTAKFPKTPEYSSTKKKHLRGGLAERLQELQNRERSAISLWRHRCVSYQMTPVDRKSSVLTVKILEVHEECSMLVALCEQLAGPPTTSPPHGPAPKPGARLKVLFTRETADHLMGRPQDVLYIFPPWQKLLIPNGSCSIILNTYFCQKAIAKETAHEDLYSQDTSLSRRNITLAQMFRIKDITNNSSSSQYMVLPSSAGCLWDVRRNLLEQRPLEEHTVRREVLQHVRSEGSTESYKRKLTPGLFSLIDSLWPPVIPLTEPSCGQPSGETKTYLPPPIFCYIFSAHPSLGQMDAIEGDHVSKLYQPPVVRCLKEILQTNECSTRCSFYARVIYQRPQLKNLLAQKEIWLLVTDITLQTQDERDHHLPKTVPVYIAPSCVLCPEVVEELAMPVSHNLLFRDALQDNGRIVCIERTVLLPQQPLLCVPSASCDLPGPVTLDELSSLTPVNSICSVQDRLLQLLQLQCTVVDVDESTAFSWPVCDWCGSGRSEQKPADRGSFSCGHCSQSVLSPLQKRHLHVFLDCPTRPESTVKIKQSNKEADSFDSLLESSISLLLMSAASKDGSYEVESVLGKEMGPLLCFVQSITTQQTSCVTLEEIELLSTAGATAAQPPP
ncbi:DNA repair-scaffolding protein [Apodemus speciosus]|uniref:DNA repair-scaffolding protein n=1 Tax=Apodemus speciosus TaxID=105296 RepID=A0ABQ0FLA8_APOSI